MKQKSFHLVLRNKFYYKCGFTLIELSLIIFIIGFLAAFIVPRFLKLGASEIDRFIVRLNDLVVSGAQTAQSTLKVQKVLFDFLAKKVELMALDSKDSKRSIDMPQGFIIDDFLINRKSQFIEGAGRKLSAYFLINPQGITQETAIIFRQEENPEIIYKMVLNPFTTEFEIE